jgi:hypothetical protein
MREKISDKLVRTVEPPADRLSITVWDTEVGQMVQMMQRWALDEASCLHSTAGVFWLAAIPLRFLPPSFSS